MKFNIAAIYGLEQANALLPLSLGDVTIYATVSLKGALAIGDRCTSAFEQNHFTVLALGLVLQRREWPSFSNYLSEEPVAFRNTKLS